MIRDILRPLSPQYMAKVAIGFVVGLGAVLFILWGGIAVGG